MPVCPLALAWRPFSSYAERMMYCPIEETVDALVSFKVNGRYPLLQAFRWRDRRFDVVRIDGVRRCAGQPRPPADEPRSYGHFSSRWTPSSEASSSPRPSHSAGLCYRVRTAQNCFELRLDLERSQWVLEALVGDIEIDAEA